MSDVTLLTVQLHGKTVGTLTLLANEQILFSFNASYINDPNRSVLSLSFKNRLGELITDFRPTRLKLPTFFSNLLPEGHMRDYLASHAGVKSQREFFLLQALGQDLPGAITITADEDNKKNSEYNINNSNKSSSKDRLRFSLAGVQLKLSAMMESTGGLTIPAEGIGGSWIVKLPSTRFPAVPENEYSMMSLARSVGMDIPDVKLLPLEKISGLPSDLNTLKGQALAVRRFDRSDKGVVHIEDFAQIFGVYPKDKYNYGNYKNIAEVLLAETSEKDIVEFIRRLTFNTLIGNADMHLKNWSLIYPDRHQAVLAPGYDFVSTIAYIADENMALNYVKSKRMADFSLEQLSYFAAKAELPEELILNSAKNTVQRFKDKWTSEHKHLPLSAKATHAIKKHLQTIKIMQEVV